MAPVKRSVMGTLGASLDAASPHYYTAPDAPLGDRPAVGKLATVLAAALCLVATTYLVAGRTSAADSFRIQVPKAPRAVLQSAQRSVASDTRSSSEYPAPAQRPRQQQLKAAVVAGVVASTLQANAAEFDIDLFSNLNSADYDAATKRADLGKLRQKQEDVFANMLRGKTAPNPKVDETQLPQPKLKPEARARSAPQAPRPQRKPATPKASSDAGSAFNPALIAGGLVAGLAATLGFLLTRSTPTKRTQAKAAVLRAIEGTNLGYKVSDENAAQIERLIKALEKQNPTRDPLRSLFIDGKWELLYSTSSRILGKSRSKAIFEVIDMDSGSYKLEQTQNALLFFQTGGTLPAVLDVVDGKKAMLMRSDGRTVRAMKEAQQERGSLRGSLRQASEAGATAVLGELITTYLDDTWRVSRDEDGEVSVFRRQGAVDDFMEEEEEEGKEEDEETPAPARRMPLPPARRPLRAAYEETQDENLAKPATKPVFPNFFGSKAGPTKKQEDTADEEEDEKPRTSKPGMNFTVPSFFGSKASPKNQAEQEEEDDDELTPSKPAAKFTPPSFFGRKASPKKQAEKEEDEDEEQPAVAKPAARGPAPWFSTPKAAPKKPMEEDDDEEEPEPAPKPAAKPTPPRFFALKALAAKKVEADEEEEEEEAPEPPKPKAKPKPQPKPTPFKLSFGAPSQPKKAKLEEEEEKSSPDAAKARLLELIGGVNRGADASPEETEAIEKAVKEVEALNPTPAPLKSPLVNGKWELLYTTSASILGTDKPAQLRPKGPIYQYIDTENLRAYNEQTLQPIGGVAVPASVSAILTVESDSRVAVQFDKYSVGPLALSSVTDSDAWLDVTYLDDDLRISRGNRGNLFVLRMSDRNARQPTRK